MALPCYYYYEYTSIETLQHGANIGRTLATTIYAACDKVMSTYAGDDKGQSTQHAASRRASRRQTMILILLCTLYRYHLRTVLLLLSVVSSIVVNRDRVHRDVRPLYTCVLITHSVLARPPSNTKIVARTLYDISSYHYWTHQSGRETILAR